MKKANEYWDGCAKKYDERALETYSDTYDATVKESLPYLKASDTVLDLACGTGITTLEIAKHVSKVYAVDLSEDMIAKAREKAAVQGIHNIEFLVSPIEDLDFSAKKFDVVIAFNVLYFLRDLKTALASIHKLLKPGGIFLSATDCLGEKKTIKTVMLATMSKIKALPHFKMYKTKTLRDMIAKNGFTVIDTKNLYDSPPNYFIAAKKR